MQANDPMSRLAMGVEYCGDAYRGWQRQNSHYPSVQGCIEHALSQLANESIQVFAAGRTDAGVHATGQVIHFLTSACRLSEQWVRGGNYYLPCDIRLQWVKSVSEGFHARHSADCREYIYWVTSESHPKSCIDRQAWHTPYRLNGSILEKASQLFLGEHDFGAFRSAQCQASTPYRKILSVEISQLQGHYFIRIKANAFLHHMVRYIVFALIQVAANKRPIDWIVTALAKGRDARMEQLAPPHGLYLVDVHYPEAFQLPNCSSRSVVELLSRAAPGMVFRA